MADIDKVITLEKAEARKDREWRTRRANEIRRLADRLEAGDEKLESLMVVCFDEEGLQYIWAAGKMSLGFFAMDVAKQALTQEFIDGKFA